MNEIKIKTMAVFTHLFQKSKLLMSIYPTVKNNILAKTWISVFYLLWPLWTTYIVCLFKGPVNEI